MVLKFIKLFDYEQNLVFLFQHFLNTYENFNQFHIIIEPLTFQHYLQSSIDINNTIHIVLSHLLTMY